MDVFNRPPAISEDTLQYTLYPPSGLADKASVTTFAACIESFIESLTHGLIWHRDPFELKVVSDSDNDGWMLEGRMRVGDCVDDEWCVVWLLKELSVKWDVAISVFDSDGEFLLIEAAEALPSWVKPSNTENRVWIYNAHLHLVPLSHISPASRKRQKRRRLPNSKDSDDEDTIGQDESEGWISTQDALILLRDGTVDTQAPMEVEKLVWQRVSGYPAAIRNHIHATKVYIPSEIARALSTNATLVQKPIETFYTRDAIQLRAAHRMARFPPEPSVLSTVTMTRTAYAQLVGQRFHPPKIFGRWREKEGTQEWRWRDVGMKLACGFEMLYQESKSRTDVSNFSANIVQSSASARKDALRRNPEYIKYIQNLISSGYFKGELEGSQQYSVLEDKAAATFVEVRREDDATRPTFSALFTDAVSQSAVLVPASTPAEEDPDDWLNVDQHDFDAMLERTAGTSKDKVKQPEAMDVDKREGDETVEDRIATEQAARLQDLAQKVENFVEGEGDIEGAQFEDEEFSDEEFTDEKMSDSDSDSDSDSVDDDISSISRQEAMDKLVPSLEPSEYGRLPASFYTNSQRVAPTIKGDCVDEEVTGHAAKDSTSPEAFVRPIRQPILSRDRYDGVDSDDETDEEDAPEKDDESEEDQPQVIGEVEVDMGEEEAEFLEFSRQALGISDEQWGEIIRSRKGRGAFVPSNVISTPAKSSTPANKTASAAERPTQGRPPAPGPLPNVNPNLDSFEAVMQAMDAELARTHKPKTKVDPVKPSTSDKGKGKAKAPSVEDEIDIETAMDAELRSLLEKGTGDEEDEEPMDYNLIKNFLESFKSQGGLSGPVSNLAGRLQPDWQLPRDEA